MSPSGGGSAYLCHSVKTNTTLSAAKLLRLTAVSYLEKFPLWSSKYLDFKDWKEIFSLSTGRSESEKALPKENLD